MDNMKIKLLMKDNKVEQIECKGKVIYGKPEEDYATTILRAQKEFEKENIPFGDYWRNKSVAVEKVNTEVNDMTKPEVKKVEKVTEAPNKLKDVFKRNKKKILAGLLTLTLIFGVGCAVKKYIDTKEPISVEKNVDSEYTDNEQLNKILNEIAKCEDGEAIVDRILMYDDFQKQYNENMLKHKDANGNTIYLKAEEIAAVDAIANSTNIDVPLTIDKDLVICNFLEAGKASTDAMYISNNKSGFSNFIVDENVKTEYVEIENSVQSALNKDSNANANCRNAFAKLYTTPETYPEATSLSAYDGNLQIAGLKGAIDGNTITKYQDRTKTDNAILNYSLNYISAKENSDSEVYKLALQAYDIMNEENIKVDLKSRELFDASKTAEAMAKESNLLNNSSSTSKITKKQTTTKKESITKEEAVNKFGQDAVEKAEEDAKDNTYVDTDGDGKVDTSVSDSEEISNQEEQKLQEKAKGWEAGWAAGRKDGLANVASNPSCTGSAAYQEGYKEGYQAGYANGQKQYQAGLEKDQVIDEQVTYNTETNTETASKKVIEIQSNGITYTSEIETKEEPKSLVRGIVK